MDAIVPAFAPRFRTPGGHAHQVWCAILVADLDRRVALVSFFTKAELANERPPPARASERVRLGAAMKIGAAKPAPLSITLQRRPKI